MRRFVVACLLLVTVGFSPASAQDIRFNWPTPLNAGDMPDATGLLPPASAMPTLPLPEPLLPGTLIFKFEEYSAEYRVLTLTLDTRGYAYNITHRQGIHAISPSGQYGIVTVPGGSVDAITCGIVDMLTGTMVDQFATAGVCHDTNLFWSPDNTRILFPAWDDAGRSALGIRHDGQTDIYRPEPAGSVDLGGQPLSDERYYIPRGWVSNNMVSFDVGLNGASSEQLFAPLDDLSSGYPASELLLEQTGQRYVLSRPAQPLESINRGIWLTDFITGDSFELAPPGHLASLAAVAPDESAVVYWAATETSWGTTHPLRLALYFPDTDEQVVLLQFDGPTSGSLVTRPGQLIWNPEGIYFYISQQPGALSQLQTGTYRIQPDGSALEYISGELLWSAVGS